VTALVEPELEEPVLDELVAGVEVADVVDVVGVEVVVVLVVDVLVVVGVVDAPLPEEPEAVVVVWVVAFWAVVWRASAGSWPLTRVMVISSQVATNSASVPATTRRRSIRTRARRACLMVVASVGVMATGSAGPVATA
jgi:hypothetical protein